MQWLTKEKYKCCHKNTNHRNSRPVTYNLGPADISVTKNWKFELQSPHSHFGSSCCLFWGEQHIGVPLWIELILNLLPAPLAQSLFFRLYWIPVTFSHLLECEISLLPETPMYQFMEDSGLVVLALGCGWSLVGQGRRKKYRNCKLAEDLSQKTQRHSRNQNAPEGNV